jgi:phosphatidylserine/phosphatidylglycerophosphate/cardiolipin synthase-like enzyme
MSDTHMPRAMDGLLAQLDATLLDARLSDAERRELSHTLREIAPPEEGLRQMRNRAFDLVRARIGDPESQDLLRWLEGVVRAIDTGREPVGVVQTKAFFSPGEACLRTIVEQLRGARRRADLCVFTVSDDRIADEILAAHRRGVAVRLISDNDKVHDDGSDVLALQSAGVAVALDRTPAHMHHKFALIDGTWLLNGSYNWTRSACMVNEENLVLTNDPSLVKQFSQVFEDLWRTLS